MAKNRTVGVPNRISPDAGKEPFRTHTTEKIGKNLIHTQELLIVLVFSVSSCELTSL